MSLRTLTHASRALRPTPEQPARTPLVSVVIPCYNYARYLAEAVNSAVSQEGVDVDVIIVDDASTDGSPRLARLIAAADPHVRAVLHPSNMGHIATYNDGLSRVTGDYVVLLSADDVLAPGALARSTALMERHPAVSLVYGFAEEFSGEVPEPQERRTKWSIWSGNDWIRTMCKRGSNIIVNPEAVVRRSTLQQLRGYRADMPQAADMEFWLRAASMGDVGRINGPVQAYYRVHGANMHLTNFDASLDEIRARRDVFDAFCPIHMPYDAGRSLLRVAHRAMAVEAMRTAIHLADNQQAGAASDLAGFAMETHPPVTASRLWASYIKRLEGRVSKMRKSASEFLYRLRWALRWRRWRWLGV